MSPLLCEDSTCAYGQSKRRKDHHCTYSSSFAWRVLCYTASMSCRFQRRGSRPSPRANRKIGAIVERAPCKLQPALMRDAFDMTQEER